MATCKVGSIHQIHTRLTEAGYSVSEYTLRIWVKNKMLPVSWAGISGTKALISFDNVVALLEGHNPPPQSDT